MKKAVFLAVLVVFCGFAVLFLLNKKDVMNNGASRNVVSNKTKTSVVHKVENKDTFIQNEYHPIVFAKPDDDENGLVSNVSLLGGSKDGNWVDLDNQKVKVGGQLLEKNCMNLPGEDGDKAIYAEIDMVKGGETYRFYSAKEYLASSEGMKPVISINGHTGDKIFCLDLKKPFKVSNSSGLLFGINSQWNPLPRIPKEIDANTILIDLDNDGIVEKIIREEKKMKRKVLMMYHL